MIMKYLPYGVPNLQGKKWLPLRTLQLFTEQTLSKHVIHRLLLSWGHHTLNGVFFW